MKLLAFFILFTSALFGATIDDINIKSGSDFQILLSLDSKFDGRVIRHDAPTYLSVVLKGLKYDKNKVSTTSEFIKNVDILAKNDDTYIIFNGKNIGLEYDLEVLNSSSAIKIILKPKNSLLPDNSSLLENAVVSLSPKGLSNIINIDWQYILAFGILFCLIVVFFIANKLIFKKKKNFEFSYFKKPSVSVTQSINLGMKNKIVVVDSNDYNYILFISNNGAFMLDKSPKMKEQDIKLLLEKKENKISYLLKEYEDKYEK